MPQYEHWKQEEGASILMPAGQTSRHLLVGFTLCCVIEAMSWEEAQTAYTKHMLENFPRREAVFPGQGPPIEGKPWFPTTDTRYGEQHAV